MSGANNTGRFVLEGTLVDASKCLNSRFAISCDGNFGGLPEYIIPDALNNGAIKLTNVYGVNPEF